MSDDARDAADAPPTGIAHADAVTRRPAEGGDAACWLDRVCPECGRLDDGPAPEVCPTCGTRRS